MREFEVKEMIVNRHAEFEQILRKELTIAKNIIKNPTLLRKGENMLNYEKLEIYEFKNYDKMINKGIGSESRLSQKNNVFRQSFNLSQEDLQKSKFKIRRSSEVKISPRSDFSSLKLDRKKEIRKMINRYQNILNLDNLNLSNMSEARVPNSVRKTKRTNFKFTGSSITPTSTRFSHRAKSIAEVTSGEQNIVISSENQEI